ncbi:MAG: ATP-dependent sacrificial sulfur transferase LarE [Bacteroidota bacterium]
MTTEEKYNKLKDILREMGHVIVAYSGGVDSAFLLKVAVDVLGEKAYGVLAVSPTYPSREYDQAKKLADSMGAKLRVITTNEIENQDFVENPVNRCYFCKSELFTEITKIAKRENLKNMVDGSNFDDLGDHRPGKQALKELDVRSPLQEAGLTKDEIRQLSQSLGLPTWKKEALACLSSRFPYGEKIDATKLKMVDEAENFLRDLGFRNLRARHQKTTIKIEVDPDDIAKFFHDEIRKKVVTKMKEIGYTYVTVDLEGYRSGSMNEGINKNSNVDPGNLKLVN